MLVEHGNALTLYLLYFFTPSKKYIKNTAIVRWPWNIIIFPGNTIKTGVFSQKTSYVFSLNAEGKVLWELVACICRTLPNGKRMLKVFLQHVGHIADDQKMCKKQPDLADDLPMAYLMANLEMPC